MNCHTPWKPDSQTEFPCGRCNFCRQNRRMEWAFRIMQQAKASQNNLFVTLTYDEENLPREKITLVDDEGQIIKKENPKGRPTLVKSDLSNFHHQVRKHNDRNRPKGEANILEYYAAGEYGSKFGRPHYHSILMGLTNASYDHIMQGGIWEYGRIHVGSLTPASASYVCKYIVDKQHFLHKPVKPFNTMSRAVGMNYLTEAMKFYHRPDDDVLNMINYGTTADGIKQRLPRAYKKKLFTKEDLALLGEMGQELAELKKEERIAAYQQERIDYDKALWGNTLEAQRISWEKAMEKYLNEVEDHYIKIGAKSLQLNTL